MKRILSLTLTVALVALVAGTVFARPDTQDSRVNFEYLRAEKAIQSNTSTREDTLWLFAESGAGSYGSTGTNDRGYTFDNAGGPDLAGFSLFDATAQSANYWHLQDLALSNGHGTDFQGADDFADGGATTGNDYAWWCGSEANCGWMNPTGYGTNWEQFLIVTVPAFATDVTIDFAYIADFEGDTYDNFQLLVKEGAADAVELISNQVSGEQLLTNYSHTFTSAEYPAADELIFRFASDGGWSDEDGSFITDIGAVWIDNVVLTVDGVEAFAYDFEDGVESNYPEFTATAPAGAGIYGALYANLFSEDICSVNATYAWAFFDLNTTNPEYPIPVTAYGPPYFDNGIQSPLLTKAHVAGDANSVSVESVMAAGGAQVWLDYWVYLDMDLNSLVFQRFDVSAATNEVPCLGLWANDNTVYYGDDKVWAATSRDVTLYAAASAAGNTINGLATRLSATDMCGVWCNTYGDGTGHSPAPYFDNVAMKIISASSIAWDVPYFRKLQDNFPEHGDGGLGGALGMVRIDSAIDVQPTAGTTLVIGDSTRVQLNMDLDGGIMPSTYDANRPSLYMYWRCSAGPNTGTTAAAAGDPDATDGIHSPTVATDVQYGVTWNVALADTARYQDTISPGSYAFDFADDYFEGGDIIEFYFKATSNNMTTETRPGWAESSDPDLRSAYTVRCLPTAGATMLFCEDDLGVLPWWREAFTYNGYTGYDIYSTQAPTSGLHNGLGGRAEIGDLDGYSMIVWDSGNIPTYTITNALPDDITFDDDLLDDWLINNDEDVCGWFMGCEIATDLTDDTVFLQTNLGSQRILSPNYYDDVTGVLVPKVYASHTALQIGGLEPYFWVDGGCPSIENFDMVDVFGALANESHRWEDDGGTTAKAGIFNRDPDGNGTDVDAAGHSNRTLFNPFSYYQVWDAGFGVGGGFDYARQMVGDVLTYLCTFGPNTTPDAAGTVPAKTEIAGNFPNPFNPTTTIKFALSTDEIVHLNVYDLSGRMVKTLVNGPMAAEDHEVIWNGKDDSGNRVASGVYFYKLVAGDFTATEKMVMLK
jgi:hypothetical protein